MTDLNQVNLTGRIVRDAILEKKANIVYAKFSIAVNKDVKTENGDYVSVPTFIDLAIFDNYAEKMYQFLRKGTLILVLGSLKQRLWTKDDLKINSLGVSVNTIKLLSSKTSENNVDGFQENKKEVETNKNFNSAVQNIEPSDSDLQGVF